MSAETVVFGYICLDPAHRGENAQVFIGFVFDELYPFPNIFSEIHPGYGGDCVSFAGILKSLHEDWAEWEARFECLLMQLYGRSARVQLDHETDGAIKKLSYLCPEGWQSMVGIEKRTWTKWYYTPHHEAASEGVPVILAR